MVKIYRGKEQTKKAKLEVKNISYLRVSTDGQDTEKNKADILVFSHQRGFGKVQFIEEKVSGKKNWKERKIKSIIDQLGAGDRLIVPELSRLGRSMLEIMEILSVAKQKGIAIYDVKNGFELNGKIQGELMAMIFAMAAQIEHDLIVSRTKEGLRAARAQGRVGGRPKGSGKSKLDQYQPEIEALLKNGSRKEFIAKRFNTTPENLWYWMKKKGIKITPTP